MGAMKNFLLEQAGLTKPDPELDNIPMPDTEQTREAFAFYCSVADGSYSEVEHLSPRYILRAKLIASAGYEAYLRHASEKT